MVLPQFEGSSLDAQKALYLPLGAASPLWAYFAGAAGAGLAYWWMTRWTDRTNLEAMLSPAAPPKAPLLATPEPIAPGPFMPEPPVSEPAPAAVLAEPEPIAAAVAEKLVEPASAVQDAVADIAQAALEPEPLAKGKAKAKPGAEPPPLA